MRAARAFAVLVGLAFLLAGPRAEAACHAFTVDAPSSVNEGDKVKITVERDAAVNPSSVQVTTVNGTAKAPGDYTAYNERVSFTGDETTKTIEIPTKEDTTTEPDETFSVKVSDGEGCAINPNFQYGDPAKVTIKNGDVAAPKSTPIATPASTPVTTVASSPTASPSPSPTGSPEATDSPSPSPSATAFATDVEEDDGGFPWLPVIAVLGFAGAAAGALILTRMRGAGA